MSSITSGVGLISGLPTSDLIDALIEAQSGSRDILTTRVTNLQAQQTALIELNARLLSMKTTVSSFSKASFFNQFSATSSNENVLTAIAGDSASPGLMNLSVLSLVTNHQIVSNGFSDADSTPVGVGTLTFELGNGRLNPPTMLGDLNGGDGVRRGKISITDKAGVTAEVDLTKAVDVNDVLEAINNADVGVTAYVSGDQIVIEDTTGGAGTFSIKDVGTGFTAQDLGIRQTAAGTTITSADLVSLTDGTKLAQLNDGNGVRKNTAGLDDFSITTADGTSFNVSLSVVPTDDTPLAVLNHGAGVRLGEIRITNRLGKSSVVDLSSATTIGEVREAINNATDSDGNALNVTATFTAASNIGRLQVSDNNEVAEDAETEFTIEDVTGHAASDLGIAKTVATGSISGSGIYRIDTIGDVVRAINNAEGNDGRVVASVDGNGIRLVDGSTGLDSLTVTAVDNGLGGVSHAAADLGIEGTYTGEAVSRDLIAGLNTVLLNSLNGGNGVELGQVSFTARDGRAATTIDFTGAVTLQEVIDRINATTATSGIEATINSAGSGIAILDVTGATTGTLEISDVSGSTATQLGFAGSVDANRLEGASAQLQYINELTRLEDLNGGRGVRSGTFQVQNSAGEVFTVDIAQGRNTIGEVIRDINTAGQAFGIVASINATGDGIAITDNAGGEGQLTITDVDGDSTATDLRIAGEAKIGETVIDGSYEIRIEVDADDTLNDVAGKIRDASPDLEASVVNDGASANGYRLSVTSGVTGRRGELIFDTGTTNLNMSTLVEARDAVALVGGAGADAPLLVTSSTNTLSDVMPGVDIELHSVSEDPVTLSVARNIDEIAGDISSFVDAYNSVIDRIDALTSFDPETEERGILLGDSTLSTIETRMARALIRRYTAAPAGTQTLSSVGITFSGDGRISFDESTFRDKYAESPDAVEALFTTEDTGFGAVFDEILAGLTDEDGGLLTRRDETIGSQVEDLNDRIEELDDRLDRERTRLEAQFTNLENVLAGLQDQQSALTQLAQLAGG